MTLAFLKSIIKKGIIVCPLILLNYFMNNTYAKNVVISDKDCKNLFIQASKNTKVTEKSYQSFKQVHCDKPTNVTVSASEDKKNNFDTLKNQTNKKDKNQIDIDSDKIVPKIDQDILKDKENGVVYPKQISARYSSEPSLRARFLTCQDQYNANKNNGGNGDVRWIQKGGGYFVRCIRDLKKVSEVNSSEK